MFNFSQALRPLVPIATVLLLCVTAAPEAKANNGASTASTQKTAPATTTSVQQENKQDKPAAQKPKQKSILDADVLERPLSYFKDSFSSDEEESDLASHSNTLMITVKALIASVLSTII